MNKTTVGGKPASFSNTSKFRRAVIISTTSSQNRSSRAGNHMRSRSARSYKSSISSYNGGRSSRDNSVSSYSLSLDRENENRDIRSYSVTSGSYVNVEADDDGAGVELVAEDYYQPDDPRSIEELEDQRRHLREQWALPKTSHATTNDDLSILGMELVSGGPASMDVISEASMPSAVGNESVSKVASRAVSAILESASGERSGRFQGKNDEKSVCASTECGTITEKMDKSAATGIDTSGFADKFTSPRRQLADLVMAVRQDANAVVRKNACGALKVMTTLPKNRRKIAWTSGVLPALTRVLLDGYSEARIRATWTLQNLCSPPENHAVIFCCPGLINAMVRVINEDRGESRRAVCCCLSLLARCSSVRMPMLQTPGVIDALIDTISPNADPDVEGDPANHAKDKSDIVANGHHTPFRRNRGTYDDDSESTSEDDDSDNDGLSQKEGSKKTGEDKTLSSAEQLDTYDRSDSPMLVGARIHAFQCCLALTKDRHTSYILARNSRFMQNILKVAALHHTPAHARAVAVLAHLSRLGTNTQCMTYRVPKLPSTLVDATSSTNDSCRNYACRALQNLTFERACRHELANVPGLIVALCRSALAPGDVERSSATMCLRHLADEPANLIPITNSPDAVATLMRIAYSSSANKPTHDPKIEQRLQYYACDAIATLSHWLSIIAMSQNSHPSKHQQQQSQISTNPKKEPFVYDPSINVHGWNQWV